MIVNFQHKIVSNLLNKNSSNILFSSSAIYCRVNKSEKIMEVKCEKFDSHSSILGRQKITKNQQLYESKMTQEFKENVGDEKKGNYIFRIQHITHSVRSLRNIYGFLLQIPTTASSDIDINIVSRMKYKFLLGSRDSIGGEIEIGKEQLLMNHFSGHLDDRDQYDNNDQNDNSLTFYKDDHLCIPIGKNITPFTLPANDSIFTIIELHLQLATEDVDKPSAISSVSALSQMSVKVFSKLTDIVNNGNRNIHRKSQVLQYQPLAFLENEIDFAGYSSFPSSHLVIYRPLSDHLFRCNFTIHQKGSSEKNWSMKSSSPRREKEKDRIYQEIFQSVTPLIREVVDIIISYTRPIFSETSLNMCAYIFNFTDNDSISIADPRSIKVEDCIIFEKCHSAKLKMNFSVSNTEKEKTVSATMINLNTLN